MHEPPQREKTMPTTAAFPAAAPSQTRPMLPPLPLLLLFLLGAVLLPFAESFSAPPPDAGRAPFGSPRGASTGDGDGAAPPPSLLDLASALNVGRAPTPLSIATVTDRIDELQRHSASESGAVGGLVALPVLRWSRSAQLDGLLRSDRDAYVATATFLASRIPRNELPNVQGVPHPDGAVLRRSRAERRRSLSEAEDWGNQSLGDGEDAAAVQYDALGRALVPDCTLPDLPAVENPLEAALLRITRDIYADITGTTRRKDIKGIPGLVEEMRSYMLSPEGSDPKVQQRDLLRTLLVLMTPVLPPFYRIFMGWRVPSRDAGDPAWLVDLVKDRIAPAVQKTVGVDLAEGTSFGPAPYAPLLTSWVAPYVFSFLVGPVRYNLRSDGSWGGIVVEKCKFLQESNCKGMCLHSCKVPAQELFDGLGLPLRVSPDFETQECQWNFGEAAPDPGDDPTWPEGCLAGCGTREAVAEMRRSEAEGRGGTAAEVANCY